MKTEWKIIIAILDVIGFAFVAYLWSTSYYMWTTPLGILLGVGNFLVGYYNQQPKPVKPLPSIVSSTYKSTLYPNRIPRNGGRSQRLS